MSVGVVFAAMQEAVQADGPKIHRKFKGTAVFQISDTNDVFSLDLKNGPGFSVTKGEIENADLTVIVESENMMKLISGELKPQQAFMKGLLKIKGKMNLAMKLTAVLSATRKKMPKAKM